MLLLLLLEYNDMQYAGAFKYYNLNQEFSGKYKTAW